MTSSQEPSKAFGSGLVGKLVAPVVVAGLIFLAAVLTLIWVAARGQDNVAAHSSSGLMEAVLTGAERDLSALVFDYGWWDEAVENLIDRPDPEWAETNIGIYAADTFGISTTFVVSENDRTLFAFRDGVPSRDDAFVYFGPGLRDLIEQARLTPMVRPSPVAGFLAREDGIYLIAANALSTDNPTPQSLVYRPRPVLVHARYMSGEMLASLSDQFGFTDLGLVPVPRREDAEKLSIALLDGKDNPVSHLVWTPPHPGFAVFSIVLPWLVAGVLVLTILGFIFVRRVTHAARAMALDAQELALKERQLAQTSKLAVLGEMAAGVVHELNQPLNIIRMATDTTQVALERFGTNEGSDQFIEQLSIIDGQTRRMAETIQSMRIFSRDDYGRKIAFNVVRAASQALSWLRPELADHGISVSLQAPGQCGRVYGEPSRFEQVIVNLILNARDAVLSHKQSGEIDSCEILIEITDDLAKDRVLIVVHDNGGGVPVEHMDRLFEPFYTTKDPGTGTGLGLSISYGIITGMDGEFFARNHPHGAEFIISLPRIAPKDVADEPPSMESED